MLIVIRSRGDISFIGKLRTTSAIGVPLREKCCLDRFTKAAKPVLTDTKGKHREISNDKIRKEPGGLPG